MVATEPGDRNHPLWVMTDLLASWQGARVKALAAADSDAR
jgi:hypothetical protein